MVLTRKKPFYIFNSNKPLVENNMAPISKNDVSKLASRTSFKTGAWGATPKLVCRLKLSNFFFEKNEKTPNAKVALWWHDKKKGND